MIVKVRKQKLEAVELPPEDLEELLDDLLTTLHELNDDVVETKETIARLEFLINKKGDVQ